jgi:hypothetical protein
MVFFIERPGFVAGRRLVQVFFCLNIDFAPISSNKGGEGVLNREKVKPLTSVVISIEKEVLCVSC